jgi:hypothetical protein
MHIKIYVFLISLFIFTILLIFYFIIPFNPNNIQDDNPNDTDNPDYPDDTDNPDDTDDTDDKISKDCKLHIKFVKDNLSKFNKYKLTDTNMIQQYLYCCEKGKNWSCPYQNNKECNMFDCYPKPKPTDCSNRLNTNENTIIVVSFNLFWWNLFGQRNGGNFSNVFKQNGPYDLMGFQECDDINRVLNDSGYGCFEGYGNFAVKQAWNPIRFNFISKGGRQISLDKNKPEGHGKRYGYWVRMKDDTSDNIIFHANLHGPLDVNTGGKNGGKQFSSDIITFIEENSKPTDTIFLTGDFNNDDNSEAIRELKKTYTLVASDWMDHIFTNGVGINSNTEIKIIRNSGSDHNGLRVKFTLK